MKKLFFVALATLFLAVSCDQKNGTVNPDGGGDANDNGCGNIATEYGTVLQTLSEAQVAYLGDKSVANCTAFKSASAAAATLFTNKRDCLITYLVSSDKTGTITEESAPGFVDGFATSYQAQADGLTCE